MAHYRKKHGKIEVVWLGRPFTYVTDWKKGFGGKDIPVLATAQTGDALVIEGEGEDQEIYHLPREEALEQFEPEDEVVHESPRGAARRTSSYDDPRRDGWREPRPSDHAREHRPAWEPYAMPSTNGTQTIAQQPTRRAEPA